MWKEGQAAVWETAKSRRGLVSAQTRHSSERCGPLDLSRHRRRDVLSSVWVNGRLVGGWPFGYASWRVDLTPYLVPPARITRDPSRQSAELFALVSGRRHLRNVWLTKTRRHVGTGVRTCGLTTCRAPSATVDLDVTSTTLERDVPVTVATRIYPLDAHGKRAGSPVATFAPTQSSVPAGGTLRSADPSRLPVPSSGDRRRHSNRIATRQSPKWRSGYVLDRYETRFGIRDIRFTGDSGVLVNGEHVYLKGVNEHHDFGALGAVFNRRAAERKLAGLREFGVNAIRMSHNPPAPELLALTDSLAFS